MNVSQAIYAFFSIMNLGAVLLSVWAHVTNDPRLTPSSADEAAVLTVVAAVSFVWAGMLAVRPNLKLAI